MRILLSPRTINIKKNVLFFFFFHLQSVEKNKTPSITYVGTTIRRFTYNNDINFIARSALLPLSLSRRRTFCPNIEIFLEFHYRTRIISQS